MLPSVARNVSSAELSLASAWNTDYLFQCRTLHNADVGCYLCILLQLFVHHADPHARLHTRR